MAGTLVRGLAAGAAAAWAKNAATTWMYEHEPREARRREDEAREGSFAYDAVARKATAAAGVELTEEQARRAGIAVHWGLGIGSVLLYAYLRRRYPVLRVAHGLGFGVPFTWLFLDEAANPMLGLSPPPQRFPWQTHARAATGHAVLWLTAESALRALHGRGPKQ